MKKKALIALTSAFSVFLIGTIGLSLAWFTTAKIVDTSRLDGSVLRSYFDIKEGKAADDTYGSQENPFVITRPKHWENLVKLQYAMKDFDIADYYFEVGKDFADGNGTNYQVYNYSNAGIADGTYSNILNLGGLATLPPLGSNEKPFRNHIKGNDLTISNFKVGGEGYGDIGIFGYVGEEIVNAKGEVISAAGTCKNLYFDNFTIDVSKASHVVTTQHEAHTKTDTPYVGYLAGHVTRSNSFTNVYVNRCTIDGASTKEGNTNNYGYYGYAEFDSLGGQYGKGSNYQFTLNSQACYNFFDQNYNVDGDPTHQISKEQLVLRNTAETASFEPDDNGDRILRMADGGKVIPFSDAVSTSTAAGSTTYVMQGNNIGASAKRNYSLSTIGFAETEFVENTHEYNLYYEKDGVRQVPSQSPHYYDHSLADANEGMVVVDGVEYPTPYYYPATDANGDRQWMYGESYNRTVIEGYDVYDFSTQITLPKYKSPGKATAASVDILEGYYRLDQGEVTPIPFGEPIYEKSNGFLFWYDFTVSLPVNLISFENLQEGTHYFSAYVHLKVTFSLSTTSSQEVYFFFGSTSADADGNLVLDPKPVLINNASKPLDIIFSQEDSIATPIVSQNGEDFVFDDKIAHISDKTFEAPVLYYEVFDGVESASPVTVDQNQIKYTDFVFVEGNPNRWEMTVVTKDPVPNGESMNYFVADQSLLTASGYNAKNIDVVGGGVSYYYQTIGNTTLAVIAMPVETTSNFMVNAPPAKGTPFYATSYLPGSIVLYLKNTSNAIDNRNDELGNISFSYVSPSILGSSLTTVAPTFKKGAGNFLSLQNAADSSEDYTAPDTGGFLQITATESIRLTERSVQKVSYCALDKDGNVLGSYNTDGSTTMSDDEKLQIDTYVIALGGYDTGDGDIWVTNVDFSYKARDGYGGTFGSVEYRSTPDTVKETVFNFFLATPVKCDYRVAVMYKENEKKYYLYVDATVTVTINYFLYQPADVTYSLSINGGANITGSGSIEIAAAPRNSWQALTLT
ncbi:MAG: hypothetical protein PUJ43_06255 [Bacillales bacterium]|nr:hypothetical protein [Bacillales bacterium]MDY5919863.1 hypothetical protein [Candidatus Enteromonas sp.]